MALLYFSMPLPLLLILVLTLASSRSASQPGFRSINCGGPGSIGDPNTQIVWEEDPFNKDDDNLGHGNSGMVQSSSSNISREMTTLRYFPRDGRNEKFCYSLEAARGSEYLIRASFLYGNYDGLNEPPTFLLIINYAPWTNVTTSPSKNPIAHELIFVSPSDNLDVCVAPNLYTNHTPFISALELRPLKSKMYQTIALQNNPLGCLPRGYGLMLWKRINYGAATGASIRYPDDPYDRIWEANTTGPPLSINSSLIGSTSLSDPEEPPAKVMATALTSQDPIKGNLSVTYEGYGGPHGYRAQMHFQEVAEELIGSPTRNFGFEIVNEHTTTEVSIVPKSEARTLVFDNTYDLPLSLQFIFYPHPGSQRSPLLNAIELFTWTLQPLSANGTFEGDVAAIVQMQEHFNIKGNGQGDPCLPNGYKWSWISCSYSQGSAPRIIGINLAHLNLTGDIPPSINNLTSLQRIDLSHNMLTGSIPDVSNLRDLTYLDVSYNNLCGSSPSLKASVNYTYQMCNSNNPIPPFSAQRKNSTRKYIIAISIVGALFIILLLVFLISPKVQQIRTRKGKTLSAKRSGIDNLKALPSMTKMFTYDEIKKATMNFTNILGQGGFGKVYHGLLPTGEEIAVKSLEDASKQGLKEFYNEVAILSRVRHKNLVCLLGYCVENTCMLIYEHIAKGNLRDLLYGNVEPIEAAVADRPLLWQTRLNIAFDASQGLEYLHNGCDPIIIHRDVKSSNILLTSKMQAKVADFGLSRLKEGDTTTSHVSTINVVGTPGYLDPAYNSTNQLTDKSDVYSFGVVLLELICGRAPIDMFTTPPHIIDWVSSAIVQGNAGDIVDPSLDKKYKMEAVWMVIDLAIGCVDSDRMRRPRMSQISGVLGRALEVEMDETSPPSSKDVSGSSATSDDKMPALQHIKHLQTTLHPR